jgi:hypothetical protein
MRKLIPISGGNNSVNGLPIQTVTCVVYDSISLEILNTTSTCNGASEMANSQYVNNKILAAHEVVKFFSDTLNAINIVGLYLYQFESFVEMHPHHPLCSEGNH